MNRRPQHQQQSFGIFLFIMLFIVSVFLSSHQDAQAQESKTGKNGSNENFSLVPESSPPNTAWRMDRYDARGTLYNPYGSTVQTTGAFVEKWVSSPAGTDWRGTLSGDVDGDGKLEVVTCKNRHIKVYEDNGTEKTDIDLTSWIAVTLQLLADVNDDGIDDICVGGQYASNQIRIAFYTGTGALLQTFNRSGGYDSSMWPVYILPDGDILVMYSAGYSKDPRGAGRWDYSTATELWYYDVGPATGDVSLADIDNDGKVEMTFRNATVHNGATGDGYNHNGTYTTDGDFYTIVVDEDGNEHFTVGYTADGQSNGSLYNYLVDLDHNGIGEVLVAECHDPTYYPGTSQIHVLDSANGSILHSFNGAYNTGWADGPGVAFADLDSDGNDEIIAGSNAGTIYVLDKQLNVVDSVAMSGSVCAVNDIDGDGELEIIVADNNTIRVLTGSLDELWSYSVNTAIRPQYVIISDLDGNAMNEIILATDKLYVLEGTTAGTAPFTVLSPNGGESWEIGSTQTIRWTINEANTSYIKIQVLRGPAGDWGASTGVYTYDWISPSATSYNWYIDPALYSANNDYWVNVARMEGIGEDWSDGNFSLVSEPSSPDFDAVYNPNNGHWYAVIRDKMNWTEANSNANNLFYKGIQGHLATLTSAEENNWVRDNLDFQEEEDLYIGGFQDPTGSEPGGGWQWVTGEVWSYANWYTGEPNNFGGYEDVLVFWTDHRLGFWNDRPKIGSRMFIVEFDLDTSALIERFYQSFLNRDPEPAEVEAWQTGYMIYMLNYDVDVRFIAREMARIFLNSPEYAARNRSDEEFLRDCYMAFLWRAPSQGELSGWLSGAWNRGQVMTILGESEEFSVLMKEMYPNCQGDPTRNFVTRMYIGVFDRLADGGGLLFWADVLNQAGDKRAAAKSMALFLFMSSEYIGMNQTTENTVIRLYRSFMGRFPSDDEVTYWAGELNSGRLTLDQVIDAFGNSAEFTRILHQYFEIPTRAGNWEIYR